MNQSERNGVKGGLSKHYFLEVFDFLAGFDDALLAAVFGSSLES